MDQGEITRHEARFGITSFIFTSRRPFHPQRLEKNIILKYFVAQFLEFMDDDEDGDEKETTEEDIDDEDDDDGEKLEDEMTEEERMKREGKQKVESLNS